MRAFLRGDVITIEIFSTQNLKSNDYDDENDDGDTITAIYMLDPTTTYMYLKRL
jgi:hypothetical protein